MKTSTRRTGKREDDQSEDQELLHVTDSTEEAVQHQPNEARLSLPGPKGVLESIMQVRDHKTKIVGTIGPASESPEMLEQLFRAGLDIARLNFSHGDFGRHGEVINRIRTAEKRIGRNVSIMADLPGPKMRVGKITPEPILLVAGTEFILTADEVSGDSQRVSMSFERLPKVVKPGDKLFLNDGLVQLIVERVAGADVHCRVAVGGELRSRKGLNIPDIDLGMSAFTDHDRACLEFAVRHGVDAVSQSFVEGAEDLERVRAAAAASGRRPFIIAKIERSAAVDRYEEILKAADGIMVARGDLGVEIPMEEIAVVQKMLIAKANAAGKPVITATQMLESMTTNRLPTRAECTDVANAILDGTDCVMLSGECAMGKYPIESVEMLAKIARVTEQTRREALGNDRGEDELNTAAEAAGLLVRHALRTVRCAAVFVPSLSGNTARMISRFKPPVWIVAISEDATVCHGLQFSYGVEPMLVHSEPEDWCGFAIKWLHEQRVEGNIALLVAAASQNRPDANPRIEFIRVGRPI